jgi:phosphotransferase system  glucose/maltose/N-acetylglucosamine-specific IIC component
MSISLRELISVFFNELKAALKEYVNKQEAALKKRLKKLLIISIAGSVLMALGISLAGSASLFILIGSLKYLSTLMPQWEAWYIMGITSAVVAAILFALLYILIRKQLSTPRPQTTQNPQPIQQIEQADTNKTPPTSPPPA